MRDIIESISGEYTRYKLLAEGALARLADDDVVAPGPGGGNSEALNAAPRFQRPAEHSAWLRHPSRP